MLNDLMHLISAVLRFQPSPCAIRGQRWFLGSLLVSLWVLGGASGLNAQWLKEGKSELRSPLLDGQPFDLIILKELADSAWLKVRPPDKPFPENPPDRGMHVFDFVVGDRFQVPFASIEEYRTFNDLLIEEADGWLEEGKFALAFRNYLYVYDRGGKNNPDLVRSLQRCLFEDAVQNFQEGRFEFSLTIFEDLYRRDPNFRVPIINRSLIEIILACYDGIIQKDFDNESFDAINQKLTFLVEKYPGDAEELKIKWEAKFDQKTEDLIARARQEASQGNGRQAHLASRQAEQLRPGDEDIKKLQDEIMQQFPLIMVGTTQPGGEIDGNRIDHWGARRVGRLVQRTLVELTGMTEEGGRYQFLNGTVRQIDEMGYVYAFDFSSAPTFWGVPQTSPYHTASRLLAAADPSSQVFNVAWQRLVSNIRIDQGRVIVTLRSPFVLPLPLMRVLYQDSITGNPSETTQATTARQYGGLLDWQSVQQDGPYVVVSHEGRVSTFEINPLYEPISGNQHPVIVEQLYRSESVAVDDLIRGNIDVVDRVPPSDLEKLKGTPEIVVRPYLVPTVHMLVPKVRHELNHSPYFRSGLSHAIDRRMLVEKSISGGRELSGLEVISGPFPIGLDENEQIGYAYNIQVRPTRFNEQLAYVLVTLALILDGQAKEEKAKKERAEMERLRQSQSPVQVGPQDEEVPAEAEDPPSADLTAEASESEEQEAEKVLKTLPPNLVIAHPSGSTATESAEAIARMWSTIGIPTTTRALPPNQSIPPDEDWDFLYLEAIMEEPLTDILKVLGSEGIAKDTSAVLDQTLNNLANANSWRGASNNLRRLHRQVAVELAIIPLYQVKEHYAYRNTVAGIGRELIHLYQNVERWKIDVYGSEDDE